MRCDYSYTLAKWQCHSIDKTPTLRFKVFTPHDGIEVIDCCPVCANLLTEELKKRNEKYEIETLVKGDSNAVPTTRP